MGPSQSRLAGADLKAPKASLVKSHGGERLGKVTAVTVAGEAQSHTISTPEGTRLRMELVNRHALKVGRGAHGKPFQYREALRIIERIARVGP